MKHLAAFSMFYPSKDYILMKPRSTEPVHEWEQPPALTIPCPIELTRKHGVYAKKEEDFPMSVRITHADRALLIEEARHIGVTPSAFMRWCAMHAVKELCRLRTGKNPRIDL